MSATEKKEEYDNRSLIKYDKPVSTGPKKGKDGKHRGYDNKEVNSQNKEDILNSILPPREYTKDKQQLYIESVLSTVATASDVVMLHQDLNHRLKSRKARETGICAIREELYAQCFDELIRQITIDLSYRGLLLVRVRDEMRMTIQSYQTLYESALAYGMRKALQGHHKDNEMEEKRDNLKKVCENLERDVEELEKDIRNIIENDKIQMRKDREAFEEEVKTLKDRNKWMREQLEKELSGEAKREKEREEKKRNKKKKKR